MCVRTSTKGGGGAEESDEEIPEWGLLPFLRLPDIPPPRPQALSDDVMCMSEGMCHQNDTRTKA